MLPVAREFQTLALIGTLLSIILSLFAVFDLIWIWCIWAILIWFVRDFRRRVPAIEVALDYFTNRPQFTLFDNALNLIGFSPTSM